MSRRNIERLAGLFFAVGLIVLFLWVLNLNNKDGDTGENKTYVIEARFDNVGTISTRSLVKAAGVKIGRVTNIEYDSARYEALVTLSIEAQYNTFPVDTAASVLTSGLIGDQYISLEPGAETEFLVDGSEIDITQSAIIMEQIIGQLLYSNSEE